MKNHKVYCIFCLVLSLSFSCTSKRQIINGWENQYLGTVKGTLFYPDNYANYWVFTFDPHKHPDIGFVVKGTRAATRYMSLNLYLHASKQSLGSLVDNALFASSDTLVATILPTGTENAGSNNLFFDKDKGRHSIFLRYYDPQMDATGGVPLPEIQAFDLVTRKNVPLPHLRFNVLSAKLLPKIVTKFIAIKNGGKPFRKRDRLRIASYKHSGQGYFPNHDNQYLFIPVEKKTDEVAIFRFKPPSFALYPTDTTKEVRYWSMALALLDTQSPFTLMDRLARIEEDGFVYILLGEETETSDKTVFNHIPWLAPGHKTFLIYRNLLTNTAYPFAFSQCPDHNMDHPESSEAALCLGPYAPQGKIITKAAFKVEGFHSLKEN